MTDEYTLLKKRALYSHYHNVNALYKQYEGTAAEGYLYKERNKAIDAIIEFEEARLNGRKTERLKNAN